MGTPGIVGNGRYRILRRIGQGGMGAVYEATDMRLGSQVALKQMLINTPASAMAFEREAKLLAQLRHPALPTVSDYFTEDGTTFLVMQFIPGTDLAALLDQRGSAFSPKDVLGWADTILNALEYLHQQQPPVIHRDIKPHNLKLTPQGELLLLDFGIAKGSAGDPNRASNQASVLAYTLHYAPLEQIQLAGTEPRSDLYALGVTLYQLLTNVLPASALERAAMRFQQEPDPLRPADELSQDVSPAVAAVLQRAMELTPADRYAGAKDMRAALRQAAALTVPPAGLNSGAVHPVVVPPAPSRSAPNVPAQEPPVAVGSRPPATLPTERLPPVAATPLTGVVVVPVHASKSLQQPLTGRRLFGQWMVANFLWFLVTIGLAALGPASIALLGLTIGLAQWFVLRRLTSQFPTVLWLFVNGVTGPIVFTLGLAIGSTQNIGSSFTLSSFALSAVVGLICGALMGVAQWYVLRRHFRPALLWIPAQALAWGVVVLLSSVFVLFFLATGLIVGAVSGAVLVRLVSSPQVVGLPAQPSSAAP